MASYKRFEDTPAWRLAQDYAYAIFEVTREDCFKYRGDLVNQLRRAALSISNNIAEGFSRGTTNDFIYFLYISRGSCAETRSMLYFALKFPEMSGCRERRERLLQDGDRLGAQLWGWIDSLQNSEIVTIVLCITSASLAVCWFPAATSFTDNSSCSKSCSTNLAICSFFAVAASLSCSSFSLSSEILLFSYCTQFDL